MQTRSVLIGFMLFALSSHASAAIVNALFSQFPSPLQACATCELEAPSPYPGNPSPSPIPFTAISGSDTMFADTGNGPSGDASVLGYRYFDPAAASSEESDRWLIQYELFSPSGSESRQFFDGNDLGQTSTSYSSFVWLDVPAALDLASSLHRFTLYTEQVTPQPGSSLAGLAGFDPATGLPLNSDSLEMYLVTADAMAGSAFLNTNTTGGPPPTGNLQVSRPFSALDAEFDFLLNLVYLDYSSGALSFNFFSDPRAELYTYDFESSGGLDMGSTVATNLSVQAAVPLPATLWLMLSGLVLLGTAARRRLIGPKGL